MGISMQPEMEMVSRGLEKHLKPEQREQLMFLFGKVCGEDSHRIAREALGLVRTCYPYFADLAQIITRVEFNCNIIAS